MPSLPTLELGHEKSGSQAAFRAHGGRAVRHTLNFCSAVFRTLAARTPRAMVERSLRSRAPSLLSAILGGRVPWQASQCRFAAALAWLKVLFGGGFQLPQGQTKL